MSEEVKNEDNNSKKKWLWLLLLLLLIIFVVIAIVVFLKDNGTAEATDEIYDGISQEQVKDEDKPEEKAEISSSEETKKTVMAATKNHLESAITPTETTSTTATKTPITINVSDNSYFNEPVVLKIDGEDYSATITDSNGNVSKYEGNTTISEDGKYSLTIKESDGTETTITFVIDTTNPVITGVDDGKTYNSDVTPIIEEPNIDKVTLTKDDNSVEYKPGDAITEDGTYILEVTDKAGNSASVAFSIDKIAPTYTIEYSTEKVTNQDVAVTIVASEVIYGHADWDKSGNDSTITKTFSQNTEESVAFTDEAGNEVIVNISIKNIDKTAPTAKNIEYSTEQLTNGDVVVTITASEPLYGHPGWKKGNRAYKITKTFTENTEETVILKDKAGNETPVTVKITNIDKVKPTLTVKPDSLGKDPSYRTINFKLSDNRLVDKFEVNGIMRDIGDSQWGDANYDVLASLVKEGENTIVLYDVAGNTTEYKFKMDWTAPTVSNVEYSTTELTNGNVVVTITTSEPVYGHDGWSKGNRAYKITKTFTQNAEETVVVTDRAGNKLEIPVKVTNIDKVAPRLTINSNSQGNDPYYSVINFKLFDDRLIDKFEVNGIMRDVGNSQWGDANFDVLASLVREGENTIVLYDVAGNKTERKFIIDRIAPVVAVESIVERVEDADGNWIDIKGGNRLIANEDVEIVNEPGLVPVNGSSRVYEVTYTIFNPTHTGYHFINVTVRDRAGNETTTDVEIFIPEYPASSASNLNSTSLRMTKAAQKTAVASTNTTIVTDEDINNNITTPTDSIIEGDNQDDINVIPTQPIIENDNKDENTVIPADSIEADKKDEQIIPTDPIIEDNKETTPVEPVVDDNKKDVHETVQTEPIVKDEIPVQSVEEPVEPTTEPVVEEQISETIVTE